jgi:exopolyphosphatase/guanosine-5'-triphosphate,3'-diphosphate pyrophosphatase
VDIGSNTTRLLVADVERGALREVRAERAFTRLAPGQALTDRRCREVAELVAGQVARARADGAASVRILGTAAIRGAANGHELCRAVAAATGIEVEVLSGEQEAEFAFLGATAGLAARPTGVIDVGGGSSELVVGIPGQGADWWASVPVGSGVLAIAHLRGDPPGASELAALRDAARNAFGTLTPPKPDLAVAVGGSATSLARLCGPVLDTATLDAALEVVTAAPADDIARLNDLHVERVRLMPAGLVLLREAARAFDAPLAVAVGGLREGVLLQDI